MHSSLRNLLEKTQEKISKHKVDRTSISGIILVFKETKNSSYLLSSKIKLIQKYVSEIVIVFPANSQTKIGNDLVSDYPIKLIEMDFTAEINEVYALELALKKCVNDKILVVPTNLHLEEKKRELLIAYNYPLVTFVGQKGNFNPSLFFFDKWINRFTIQVLRAIGSKNLVNLFRVAQKAAYLRISEFDSILRIRNKEIKKIESEDHLGKRIISPILFDVVIDEQDIVKMIALINVVKEDAIEKGMIASTFKIQQLLTLSGKFAALGHFYLAIQPALLFSKLELKISQYPADWTLDKIIEVGRNYLDRELEYYIQERLDKLKLFCLKDRVNLDRNRHHEIHVVQQEISELEEWLSEDNIES